MSTDLYSILGISKSASPEEIRNAYKKCALNTHPDRLPPTASDQERATRTERFREVNNAYEVLSNAETRKQYDRRDTTPLPKVSKDVPHNSRHRRDPFADPFFADPFPDSSFPGNTSSSRRSRRPRPMEFMDPFEMFEQFFPDMRGLHEHSRHANHHSHPFDLSHSFRRDMDRMTQDLHDMTSTMTRSFSSSNAGNGQWVSNSYQSVMINGVQQQQYNNRDSEGNQHTKTIGPDGRETYTINGVVQNSRPSKETRQIRDRPEGRASGTRRPTYSTQPPPSQLSSFHGYRDGVHTHYAPSLAKAPSPIYASPPSAPTYSQEPLPYHPHDMQHHSSGRLSQAGQDRSNESHHNHHRSYPSIIPERENLHKKRRNDHPVQYPSGYY